MSAKELVLWQAEDLIEPFGEIRADLQAASIVQASLTPYSKTLIKLADCILNFKENEPQTDEQMQEIMKELTIRMGGKIVIRDGNDQHTGS